MYSTTSLTDACILAFKGQPFRIKAGAEICTFLFDELGESEADRILNSAEAATCRAFHRSLVALRRRMTALGGGRGHA